MDKAKVRGVVVAGEAWAGQRFYAPQLAGYIAYMPWAEGAHPWSTYPELKLVCLELSSLRMPPGACLERLYAGGLPPDICVLPLRLPETACENFTAFRRALVVKLEAMQWGGPGGGSALAVQNHQVCDERAQCRILEEALRESATRYELLVKNSPYCIHEISLNGHLISMNPAGLRMVEASCEDEVTGLYYLDVVCDEQREEIGHLLQAAIEGQASEFEFKSVGGKEFQSGFVPICDASGQVLRLMGLTQDITARKHAERRLALYREHLEALVQARNNALAQAQTKLVQNQRLASLGQLTATVAHELRNPLGVVANAVFAIKQHVERGDKDRLLRSITLAERNVHRCNRVINELLDFSGRIKLEPQAHRLDTWLRDYFAHHLLPDGMQLQLELGVDHLFRFDGEYLHRALNNIVNNATHAMKENAPGDRVIHVSTHLEGGRCEIRVRDRGPGIPDEILPQIFEPLFSTKSFGVGLGVPIVKSIMEEHGGGLDYVNHSPRGVTAILWLPVEAQCHAVE